jgi:type IV pilus assembly protein PilE
VKRARGFTLIEILAVVAIVAILAAIAYPSYQNQLAKGRRADAQAFIMDVANREQQYLLDARSYATGSGALTALNMAVPNTVTPYYTVTVADGPTTPSFVITAAVVSSSPQSADGDLVLTSTGSKTRGSPDKGW